MGRVASLTRFPLCRVTVQTVFLIALANALPRTGCFPRVFLRFFFVLNGLPQCRRACAQPNFLAALQNSSTDHKSFCISPIESRGACECVGIPAKNPVVSKWGIPCGNWFPRSAGISAPWPVSAVIGGRFANYLNSQLIPSLAFFCLRWAQGLPFSRMTTATKREWLNAQPPPHFV